MTFAIKSYKNLTYLGFPITNNVKKGRCTSFQWYFWNQIRNMSRWMSSISAHAVFPIGFYAYRTLRNQKIKAQKLECDPPNVSISAKAIATWTVHRHVYFTAECWQSVGQSFTLCRFNRKSVTYLGYFFKKVIFCLFKVTRMIHVWIPWIICFFLRRLKWMKKESGNLREKTREAEGEVHTRLIWLGRYVHKILCTRPFLRAYTVSMDNCIR